jgi:HK97 family phage major capsid protein
MAGIDRSGASALINQDVSNILLKEVANTSAAMTMFRQVSMGTSQTRLPVLGSLPTANWVSGDTGLKGTTKVDWTNKYLTAEELAVIVPIPDAVIDDADYDIWAYVRPLIADAIARKLDAAVLFGVESPASFPTSIAAGAIAAGHDIERGANTAAQGGYAEDISEAFAFVENDGFAVTGAAAASNVRALLRGARDAEGRQLTEVTPTSIYGVPINYASPGLWPTTSGSAELIAGDFSHAILGVRQDLTYKVLTEATIYGADSEVLYALAQQDMTALRVVGRFAFQVDNTINYANTDEATRYPWAIVSRP